LARYATRHILLFDCETSMTAANDLAVRAALELAGVEFIDENGGGPWRPPSQSRRPKSTLSPSGE
jgi:hypothetical protein